MNSQELSLCTTIVNIVLGAYTIFENKVKNDKSGLLIINNKVFDLVKMLLVLENGKFVHEYYVNNMVLILLLAAKGNIEILKIALKYVIILELSNSVPIVDISSVLTKL